ncbi:DUF3900 domain-containing protein [Heyndrickxia acidicola]|uniref:DUF3900 domain-containing protein n=1 Tax=Heyndrickxia acidicola TaxID=209389 RepID=A0ABU6MH72_9BACI|nr:DUF3900 domain-containing protein [Heyndrickxia acidicola]MED1204025.1 DUF3900 domain-containing protein [Heyndrickxia acidicola]
MEFRVDFISFYVIQVEGKEEQADKSFKHFQTLDTEEYEESALKEFLDGELTKIVKRKVERHPKSEQVPTKLGRFIVEPGHPLDSNPNYNQFNRARACLDKEQFKQASEEFLRIYLDTSAVRGGAFIVARATPRKYFNDSFVFIMKCDFEPKVASISDESTLIRNVEMAITTKNMKSILYPHMPEEGMTEEGELKIHQASHARYFEDFLKFVEYGESMPEIMKAQVKTMVEDHFHEVFEKESPERQAFEEEMEIWEASPKREIKERLSTEQVVEAAAQIVENTPEAQLQLKMGETSINTLLANFGDTIHLGKINGRYVLLVEADSVQFEKGFSPIEFHKPDDLHSIIEKIRIKSY